MNPPAAQPEWAEPEQTVTVARVADEPAAEPPPERGPTAAPQAPKAEAAPEELVRKLFDPLLRRLKTELRLDRERWGRATDRWH
ncbi:hypothetical protein [Actinokineospora inagensis]|uniref:hypothetical protein n=1 Tax=Actinokineospora inagensis TaxID=103730 RepID=UPI0012FBF1D7|nr:hypothetical protein [Actinokineospora inagensis]